MNKDVQIDLLIKLVEEIIEKLEDAGYKDFAEYIYDQLFILK